MGPQDSTFLFSKMYYSQLVVQISANVLKCSGWVPMWLNLTCQIIRMSGILLAWFTDLKKNRNGVRSAFVQGRTVPRSYCTWHNHTFLPTKFLGERTVCPYINYRKCVPVTQPGFQFRLKINKYWMNDQQRFIAFRCK